jgi:site-specific recombinase XerD
MGTIPYDPAASLVLPKTEHRLPEAVLSVDEVEAVLAGPDTTTALGIRDRAILEVFYSTAIRRMELIGLRVSDVDHARGTLFVRQRKGGHDPYVPIGERARRWVERYCDDARPVLARRVNADTLFLTTNGPLPVTCCLERSPPTCRPGHRPSTGDAISFGTRPPRSCWMPERMFATGRRCLDTPSWKRP